MGTSVFFDDLFSFEEGLCYLRLYRGEAEIVALAVQIDDNPGRSIVNAAEALSARIANVFGPEFCLFIHFPPEPGDGPVWTKVSNGPEGEGRAAFDRRKIPHSEIERLLGERVALPSAGAASAADVGGTSHPLLSLIPPEEEEQTTIDRMQVVAVADLPWSHKPSQCAHSERFEAIRGLYNEGFDGHIPAGAHFFLSLSSEALSACRYHQRDWQRIAAASVDLLRSLEPSSDFAEVADRASSLIDDPGDREELTFLFSHPITWSPGATSINNGQHRTCALKAAGAELCVAVTDGELHVDPVPSDPYRRAESALAEYWAGQLGRDHRLSRRRLKPE